MQTNNIALIGKLLLLLIAQAFVFNQIHFAGYISPMIYLIFLYQYPAHENKYLLLTISFLFGITLDILTDSLAFHTIALLFTAYFQHRIIDFIFGIAAEQKTFKLKDSPNTQKYTYLLLLILIHHSIFFIWEGISLSNGWLITKKILATSAASFILSTLLISLFSKVKK